MCANVLGPLDQKPTVWAECLFADPIAGIAVLGEPDAGSWSKESKAYDDLVEPIPPLKSIASLRSIEQVKSAIRRNYVTPLRIADAPEEGRAWLLSLEGEWVSMLGHHSSTTTSFCPVTLSRPSAID